MCVEGRHGVPGCRPSVWHRWLWRKGAHLYETHPSMSFRHPANLFYMPLAPCDSEACSGPLPYRVLKTLEQNSKMSM